MTDPRQWLISSICGDCLVSETGVRILSGAVGIAALSTGGEVEKCVLCGFPFRDQLREATDKGRTNEAKRQK